MLELLNFQNNPPILMGTYDKDILNSFTHEFTFFFYEISFYETTFFVLKYYPLTLPNCSQKFGFYQKYCSI